MPAFSQRSELNIKNICILLAWLLTLPFFIGCDDPEESPDSLNPVVSVQELPADDDIDGLNNLGIPRDWYQIKDPVLYVKYFRARLLRQLGNIPEVHVIADMELKIRQRVYPTRDEQITYLEALYELWPNKETLADLEYQRKVKAAGKPLAVIYSNTPEAHIREKMIEIYGQERSNKKVMIEFALIRGDAAVLQAYGWNVFPPVGPIQLRILQYGQPERFLEAFLLNGGVKLEEDESVE